jgi:uncharacterized protein YdaL
MRTLVACLALVFSFVFLSAQAEVNPFLGTWTMTSNDPVVDHIISSAANKEPILVSFTASSLTTTVGGEVQDEIEISFQYYKDRWYICDTAAFNCENLYIKGDYITIPMDRILTGKRLVLKRAY